MVAIRAARFGVVSETERDLVGTWNVLASVVFCFVRVEYCTSEADFSADEGLKSIDIQACTVALPIEKGLDCF